MSAGFPHLAVTTSPGGQKPTGPLLGVPTANPTPPVLVAPIAQPSVVPPQRLPLTPETVWPRSAQLATAVLLGLALLLLGWHSYQAQRWSARPTELHRAEDRQAAVPPPAANADRRGPSYPVSDPAKAQPAAAGKKTGNLGEKIDINQASAQELQRLPGIGPALAARIVDKREREPFQAVEDLRRVPGIGAKTFEKLRPYVTVERMPQPLLAGR